MFTLSQLCGKLSVQENFADCCETTKQIVALIDSIEDKEFIEFSHLQKSLLDAYFAIAREDKNVEAWTKAMEKGE